jgi:hypothetical protein
VSRTSGGGVTPTRVATLASLAALCLIAAAAHAQTPAKKPSAQPAFAVPNLDTK